MQKREQRCVKPPSGMQIETVLDRLEAQPLCADSLPDIGRLSGLCMSAGLPECTRVVVDCAGASVAAASRPVEQDFVLLCLERYRLETSRNGTAMLDALRRVTAIVWTRLRLPKGEYCPTNNVPCFQSSVYSENRQKLIDAG